MNTIGIDHNLDCPRIKKLLMIGLFGALLTLIGDCLIGAVKFPDGANLIEGYFAIALAMPTWRPILGGLIGFVGICLVPRSHDDLPTDPGKDAPRRQFLSARNVRLSCCRRRGGAPALRRVYVDI